MHLPSITAIYLAVPALLYAFLAIHVARLRRDDPVADVMSSGDAPDARQSTQTIRRRPEP